MYNLQHVFDSNLCCLSFIFCFNPVTRLDTTRSVYAAQNTKIYHILQVDDAAANEKVTFPSIFEIEQPNLNVDRGKHKDRLDGV